MLFGSKKLLGLDIGTSTVKMAELEEKGKRLILNRFAALPLADGAVAGGDLADPLGISQAIGGVAQLLKTKRKDVNVGMWGSSVIVKKITMPRMEEKLVAEQIKWEAEQYIPFDINDISLEHRILKSVNQSAETMDVLLVAAKQDFIIRYVESVEATGLKASCLDVNAFALANCFEYNYGSVPEAVALLDIGAGVTNFVIVERGEVVFSRDLPVGGFQYSSDIQRVMGVSFEEAEALKLNAAMGQAGPAEVASVINGTNESVLEEIRNGIDFFAATAAGSSIARIYVTGGSIFVPGLIDGIRRVVGVSCEALDPFSKIGYNPKNIGADLVAQLRPIATVALGLGMRDKGDS